MSCQACSNLDTIVGGERVACTFCNEPPRISSDYDIDYIKRLRAPKINNWNKDKNNGKG